MDKATRHLIQYARYHRDPRNIVTHFVGVPLIAFGAAVLLARWPLGWGDSAVPASVVLWALCTLWYLSLGRWPVTLSTSIAIGALVWLALPLGQAPMLEWLTWGLGSFVVGWVFQAVGHVWEGRKPAFFDDLRGLLVGPMFVLAETGFVIGIGHGLRARIEAQAGPVAPRQKQTQQQKRQKRQKRAKQQAEA